VSTSAAFAAAARGRLSRSQLRRTHPGWWMSAAAAVAWIALIMLHVNDFATASHTPSIPDMPGMPAHTGQHGPHGDPAAWTGHWALMIVAMMWPLYAGVVAAIATATFRRWQVSSVAAFITVTSALWIGFGWAARIIFLLVRPSPMWWAVVWLGVAIVSTRSLWRTRALQRCLRISVIAPSGFRAITTAAQTAARAWPRCALLCAPVMVVMVDSHQLPVMVGGSAAVWWEQRHPRAFRAWVPVAILVATLVVILAGDVLGGNSTTALIVAVSAPG
jgi:hypothetical protein